MIGNHVYRKVPGVRIPPSPPYFFFHNKNGFVAVRSDSRVPCNGMPPTPSDPEGSSGNGFSVCRGSAWLSLVPATQPCPLPNSF